MPHRANGARHGADVDAVVVGAGPNGLAAAIELARNGASVCVLEAAPAIGGGTRTEELTLPGFWNDVCSAIHPLAAGSPFFRTLPLADHGLEWIHPTVPLAHPLEGGDAAILHRSLDDTVANLGPDGKPYRRLLQPFVEGADRLLPSLMRPRPRPWPPILLARSRI